jgi:hypothetical protein
MRKQMAILPDPVADDLAPVDRDLGILLRGDEPLALVQVQRFDLVEFALKMRLKMAVHPVTPN